jgi:Bacterial SH3 domain
MVSPVQVLDRAAKRDRSNTERAVLIRAVATVVVVTLLCSTAAFARSRQRAAGAFSVDFPDKFDTVLRVVRDASEDGRIRGTYQYLGESELTGAAPADDSPLLRMKSRPDAVVLPDAVVFYKIRQHTLSPGHFIHSTDVGTVAVRYIVEKLPGDKARLTIESVFVQDSHHGRHASDGSVETSEFVAIHAKLQAIEREESEAAQRQRTERQQATVRQLERELGDELAQIDAVNHQISELQKRSQQLRQSTLAQVKAAVAELKAAPYTRAPAIAKLERGQQLTVLGRAPYWCRVKTSDGNKGWVYQLFLEAAQ